MNPGCMTRLSAFVLLIVALFVTVTRAQEQVELLGPAFESRSAGISLRPFANAKEIQNAAVPDQVVQFVSDERRWDLKVSRIRLTEPVPLVAYKDAEGRTKPGLVEQTVQQIKRTLPGAEVLREDTTNIGQGEVGLVIVRYAAGSAVRLAQHALIQANDQLYYVLEFTTPGKPKTDLTEEDPREAEAVQAMAQMLDSVKLLDLGAIRQDQVDRLIRTRALLVNWHPKRLRESLVPEMWLRLVRNGKDIGYTYVIEEVDEPRGTASGGVRIGVRSRTIPDDGFQVDTESWLQVSYDRRHEDWSNVAVVKSLKDGRVDHSSEVGTSRRHSRPVADELDKRQMSMLESYILEVKSIGKSATAVPVKRELPPMYLPQALGHLLPRILPLREAKSYMFYSYVNEQGELMARYVDVGPEQSVTLDGSTVRAIPIGDRIKYDGSVTTHWMSPDGKYLGSENRDAKIQILPTDRATLEKLWKDADFSRPAAVNKSAE